MRAAIFLATAAYVLGVAAQTTFLFFLVPAYATLEGVADAQMLAYGVQALAATLVGLSAGKLADRVPRRRVMRLGWGLEAAGALVLATLPDPVTALMLGSALVGAGLTYGFVAFQSYLPDLLRARSAAEAYGGTGALSVLGAAVAPFVAGRVLAAAGTSAAAHFAAGIAILALLLTLPLRAVTRGEHAPQPGLRLGFAAAAVRSFDPRGTWRHASGGALPYLVAFAILGLGYGLSVPWMAVFLIEDHGLSPAALGTLVAAATAIGALGMWLAGRVAARASSPLKLCSATNGALAASLVAFALAPTLLLASALFLVRHLVGNPTGSLLNAGIVAEAGSSARGLAFGATNVAWNLPWAIGALAGGALRHAWDGWLFVGAAALVVLGPVAALGLAARPRSGAKRPRARVGST